MGLPVGLVWEVRTTGNANNGGGFIDRLPGTSVDYSQQNAAQLSKADLACLLASVTLTSVTGGFTAAMVGNLIQIRAGGVNFVAGFYEIVQWNSANSVNLDRTPVAAGNGTGGLGEVGGALISPETFILKGVDGNICYVKSGTYNFAATRQYTATTPNTIVGYDTARNITPTGNNRPLFALGAFEIRTDGANGGLVLKNIQFTGTGARLIYTQSIAGQQVYLNCKFENTGGAGSRACLYPSSGITGTIVVMDCEFLATGGVGVTSYGIQLAFGTLSGGITLLFNFFHDLTYGISSPNDIYTTLFFKNTFARIDYPIYLVGGPVGDKGGLNVICNSFYSTSYHIYIYNFPYSFIYGNTLDSAVNIACQQTTFVSRMWHIENNDFWNNGGDVSNCFLDLDNIGLDPVWVNPAANDFNFGPGSPNIDQALGIRLGV